MRLSWNEVRLRAAAFAREWQDAAYEKGETQSFYNAFFEVFGKKRSSVARFEELVTKLDNRKGFIDLFWPGVLIVEQKSEGRDLAKAYEQAGEYFDALDESDKPDFILVSDFQNFELHDLDKRHITSFELSELPQKVELFSFILGVQRRVFRDQDPVNVAASEIVGLVHDALASTGYEGHDLERFLVRLVFCLFADDTGIFEPRDIFLEFLEDRTSEDGADLGPWLSQLFEVLDTPLTERSTSLDEDLAQFPYVNGDLFKTPLRIPSFDRLTREAVLDACQFDWSRISPAIFGALFQSVMDQEQRRAEGAHYTTEKNILKVIEPLFLDDLRHEFDRIKMRKDRSRRRDLHRFHERLGEIRIFDPACGCGNFLIVAYRELRELEIEIIRELGELQFFCRLDVSQFYGIEIGEFAARIAETALWMMDHIMNNRLALEMGSPFVRIPLTESPHIVHGDALEIDWDEVLPAEECTYVLGNPPFVGAKLQSAAQRSQVKRIADLGGSGGTLDYVSAWYVKAGIYVGKGTTRIGFVGTNSITQGEQVAQLWPILFDRLKLEISFAHQTFAWGSDAKGKAHVHVVIIGLDRRERANTRKRLFSYSDINGEAEESSHAALSPYLFDASGLSDPHLTVKEESNPVNGLSRLIIGSKPIDGGNYIFNADQKLEFLKQEPNAEDFLHPFIGAREFIQGNDRWILALHDAAPDELSRLKHVRERIAAVRTFRERSTSEPTRKLAETPTLFHVNVLPTSAFLVIPKTSSERRRYVPIGWQEPPVIPSDAVFVLQDASLAEFAVLTSAMHMSWLRYIGGRLKSDYRYSIGLVYNTFPLPPRFMESDTSREKLGRLAKDVLNERDKSRGASLSQLYDPDLMPTGLVRAHQALDRAVDRLYGNVRFQSDRERIECLFRIYEGMQDPLRKRKRRRSRRGSGKRVLSH